MWVTVCDELMAKFEITDYKVVNHYKVSKTINFPFSVSTNA